ncbi:hypothetical protein BKA65DRAFT_590509 [Rhexocercosporidium sp. MPI-PUGE-AT-0058]|nr:hypothetical protein BKA65DRAFT_590509 [Rhexocercosporidium sp. MPI-PUGE-AT-0058]
MATTVPRKGWLTSLIPPIVAHANIRYRFINTRPITYLKTPQISFLQEIHNAKCTKVKDSSFTVETKQSAVQSSADTAAKGSTTALFSVSQDIGALTPKSSSEDIEHTTRFDELPSQGTSSTSQSQEPSSTDVNAHKEKHHGPIHFHRRIHKNVHHNNLSDSSPLTSERRKYAIPQPDSHHPQLLTINTAPRAHTRPSIPEPISPTTIINHLQSFLEDQNWDHNYEARERSNPFPNHDQNYGWTRASCAVKMYFSCDWTPFGFNGTLDGSLEEMTYIKRNFARFSLWAQREAMEFDEGDLLGENGWGKVFDVVFKGDRVGLCWARIPGSWHAVKPGLLTCCRSVSFHDEVLNWKDEIRERLRDWRARNEGWRKLQVASPKRKFKALWPGVRDEERFQRGWLGWKESERGDGVEPRVKRPRLHMRVLEKIMSEKWRARRREQEKKAGRWLDGTIRQDRLWDKFHWVLILDDPRENTDTDGTGVSGPRDQELAPLQEGARNDVIMKIAGTAITPAIIEDGCSPGQDHLVEAEAGDDHIPPKDEDTCTILVELVDHEHVHLTVIGVIIGRGHPEVGDPTGPDPDPARLGTADGARGLL